MEQKYSLEAKYSFEGVSRDEILKAYKDKLAEQPAESKIPLFYHQLYNIRQMREREKSLCIPLSNDDTVQSRVGILGDPPGTGKTKTAIFAIKQSGLDWPKTPFYTQTIQVCSNIDGNIRIERKESFIRTQTTCIITNASILNQWLEELVLANISYKAIRNHADFQTDEVFRYEVVVCVDTMYNDFAAKFHTHAFKAMYFDEMDSTYIPNMERMVAGFYWLISATFSTVLEKVLRSRNLHFMKRLFNEILSDTYSQEDLLNAITILSPEDLRDLNPLPDCAYVFNYENEGYHLTQALYPFLDKEIISMIESGDVWNVPQKIIRDTELENLYSVLVEKIGQQLLETEEKMAKYAGKSLAKKTYEEWVKRNQIVIRKRNLLSELIQKAMEKPCPTCGGIMIEPQLALCCYANVCLKCAKGMHKEDCKMCKKKFVPIPFFEAKEDKEKYCPCQEGVSEDANLSTNIHQPKTKLDQVREILKQGQKILIFASSNGSFETLTKTIVEIGKKSLLFTGSNATREKLLSQFKSGKVDCLIMKDQKNSAGMNLQCTTDIIIWNYMPPAFERQAIGRAVRPGLDHDVKIHRFSLQVKFFNESLEDV